MCPGSLDVELMLMNVLKLGQDVCSEYRLDGLG